jgi:hypothetical protein
MYFFLSLVTDLVCIFQVSTIVSQNGAPLPPKKVKKENSESTNDNNLIPPPSNEVPAGYYDDIVPPPSIQVTPGSQTTAT